MATDLERLVVSLEANIKKYESSLAKAMSQTNTQAGKIETRFKKMNKDVERSFDFSGVAARGLATLGIGLSAAGSLKAVAAAAQEFTALQNALKVTGLEGAELERTFSALYQIAQKNGTAIAPLTTLYSRASQAQKELNASSADLLKFTDGVSVALRVAGSTSTQAAGALLQLSQAIGGGVVRAEEFNSVNEGARPILQAVAAGLLEAGGSVAKLKTLVTEGKVSSEAFFRAFLAGMPQLEAQVAKADGTIGQATSRISNAFILLVGNLDKTTGASSNAAKNLSALGGVLEGLPGYFDAAGGKLDVLQKKMTELGNSSVWMKIGKFLGVDYSEAGIRAAGLEPANPASNAPRGRIAEGARDRLGQALAPAAIKPVSLKNFKLPGAEEGAKALDVFQRSTAAIEKRIAIMGSEVATLDLGTGARERARVVIEMETAARKANEAAGLGQNVITAAQRAEIDRLATSYAVATQKLESMNTPLMQLGRSSADVSKQLNELAAGSLNSLTDELADVVTGTQTVQEAFTKMATAIINDLARIAIRQSITGPIASALGGLFGGGSGSFMVGNQSFPKFASGGYTGSGGKYEPAGVVHKGEFVFDQAAVNRIGVSNLRRLQKGYADGGPVGMPSLKPASSAGRAGFSFTYAPVIDARGVDPRQLGQLAIQQAKFQRDFERNVRAVVGKTRANNPGF